MNHATRLEKLRKKSEHLLDLLIALEEKHAMLRGMLQDGDVRKSIGGGPATLGLIIIRNSLLESCVLDLFKLTLDTDKRGVSLACIYETLSDAEVRRQLLRDYTTTPPLCCGRDKHPIQEEAQDVIREHWNENLREHWNENLTVRFKVKWNEFKGRWTALAEDERLKQLKRWRDKWIAHYELRHDQGNYRPVDLAGLVLSWNDLTDLLRELRWIVDAVQDLTRSAGLLWDTLDDQLAEGARSFWALSDLCKER